MKAKTLPADQRKSGKLVYSQRSIKTTGFRLLPGYIMYNLSWHIRQFCSDRLQH